MKRTLRLTKKDGSYVDLNVVKATAIKSGVGMLHLDKVNNGYRLIVSEDIIDDMTQFDNLKMIRED